jgi:hypothetical protein
MKDLKRDFTEESAQNAASRISAMGIPRRKTPQFTVYPAGVMKMVQPAL